MLKKKFKFSAIISILIISLLILTVLVYNKKSFFINKVNEIAPNFVQKVRFYYFNLPHNLPSIPSSNPVTNDLDFKLSLKSLVFKNSKSKNLKIFNEKKKNYILYAEKKLFVKRYIK